MFSLLSPRFSSGNMCCACSAVSLCVPEPHAPLKLAKALLSRACYTLPPTVEAAGIRFKPHILPVGVTLWANCVRDHQEIRSVARPRWSRRGWAVGHGRPMGRPQLVVAGKGLLGGAYACEGHNGQQRYLGWAPAVAYPAAAPAPCKTYVRGSRCIGTPRHKALRHVG